MGFRKWREREFDPDEVRMTLGEHLEELRSRIVRALIALGLGAILSFVCIGYVMSFILWPMYGVLKSHHLPATLYQFSPEEMFVMELKVAFIAGFILTAPYGLAQIWGFIAAGLYKHERRWVRRFLPVSIALFFIGALFMQFTVAPIMMKFFIEYRTTYPDISKYLPHWLTGFDTTPIGGKPEEHAVWPATQPVPVLATDPKNPPEGAPWLSQGSDEIRIRFGDKVYSMGPLTEVKDGNRVVPMIRLTDYVVLVAGMMAAFGIGFQMPVVVALIATLGIASAKEMAGFRRHVYFAIAVAAAIITPSADALSMMALMVPMVALFEIGLVAARLIERERAEASASS
jgi:sec-independent protein translocase protein TatC